MGVPRSTLPPQFPGTYHSVAETFGSAMWLQDSSRAPGQVIQPGYGFWGCFTRASQPSLLFLLLPPQPSTVTGKETSPLCRPEPEGGLISTEGIEGEDRVK